MTSSIVVDASAFAAVLFKEPDGDVLAERWADRRILAPRLLNFELANVVLVKGRREPHKMRACIEAFEIFLHSKIEFSDVDFLAVLPLAQRRNLSAYDASYVWLALSRGLDLVSLDRRMIAVFEMETAR